MSIFCRLFGHKTLEHEYDGANYMKVSPGAIDGLLREHASLLARCPRCSVTYHAGNIHRPQPWDAPSQRYLADRQKNVFAAYKEKP